MVYRCWFRCGELMDARLRLRLVRVYDLGDGPVWPNVTTVAVYHCHATGHPA